jgi:uncharacterized protein
MTSPSGTNEDWSGLEVLSGDECRRLLSTTAVGRVGFVDAGSPMILPVNFAMDGHAVVFRSAPGSKLAAAMLQRPVAFEIDDWDPMDHTGWSVLATGVADLVDEPDDVARLERLPVRPWSRPDVRDRWVRVMVEELSGRRILRPG